MGNNNHSSDYIIEGLPADLSNAALEFLESVFSKEQNIPKELIPLTQEEQKWWCIRKGKEVVGTVAAWNLNAEWHWGRLAVHQQLRGLGLGKQLVRKSFNELFQMEVEKVVIDARDITVEMVLGLGGKVTGEKSSFYNYPITPMVIEKKDYIFKSEPGS
ncbi:GNAT family N-acetyltransferase [Flammeovirgaceae bacterium SG7u.111]|nr:GNAT family N-acetyltransferase [Flammeovirgaceae bacterium SG7u.132]WPO37373.1 GNAT family N-acetyltransferase [Flammeovirgaceae bacterium SG7u.111]